MSSLNQLVEDMVEAARNYPGIDLIWYRNAVGITYDIANLFMSIAIILLSISIPVMMAIELLFINFPPLTAALIKRESIMESANVEKKSRNLGLFVNSARLALRLQAETGKNINYCYMVVKWKMLLCLTFVLGTLITGGQFIIDGITRAIGGLLLRI